MGCSGSHSCNCTGFRSGKPSTSCKICFHPEDAHYDSSPSDSLDDDSASNDNGDSDNSHPQGSSGTRQSAGSKNKKTVSDIINKLVHGSEYTDGQVGKAKHEANTGLTGNHVSYSIGLHLQLELTVQHPRGISQKKKPTLSSLVAARRKFSALLCSHTEKRSVHLKFSSGQYSPDSECQGKYSKVSFPHGFGATRTARPCCPGSRGQPTHLWQGLEFEGNVFLFPAIPTTTV